MTRSTKSVFEMFRMYFCIEQLNFQLFVRRSIVLFYIPFTHNYFDVTKFYLNSEMTLYCYLSTERFVCEHSLDCTHYVNVLSDICKLR